MGYLPGMWHDFGVATGGLATLFSQATTAIDRTDDDLTLRGPNGYWRRYAGTFAADAGQAEALLVEHADKRAVELRLVNGGGKPVTFVAAMDDAYPAIGERVRRIGVAPGGTQSVFVPLDASDDWYDLAITLQGDGNDAASGFLRRFAGRRAILPQNRRATLRTDH